MKVMKNRICSMILVVIMLLCMLPTAALAAENQTASIFSDEVLAELAPDASDSPATMTRMSEIMDEYGDEEWYTPYLNEPEIVTVDRMLQEYMLAFSEPYFRYDGDRFYWVQEDTMWLTTDEWNRMVDNFTEPVSEKTVVAFCKRSADAAEYMRLHKICDTPERYLELVQAILPEFDELAKANPKALAFWLKYVPSVSTGEDWLFPAILHEIAHEESALKSHVYDGRFVKSSSMGITWSSRPNVMHYYDPASGEWLDVRMRQMANTRTYLTDTPDSVKEFHMYSHYMRSGAMAYDYGVYGLLQEFCSDMISLRTEVVLAFFQHGTDELSLDTRMSYYFWKGAVLQCMAGMKDETNYQYQALLSDDGFVTLVHDLITYGQKQMDLMPYSLSWRNCPFVLKCMMEWAADENASAVWQEIENKYNVIVEKTVESDLVQEQVA